MRKELIALTEKDYWVYGLSESDFDYTLDLAKGYIDAKNEQYKKYEEKIKRENPDDADDILDDVAYYTYIDNQYIWQFCLWRLQGIFEGIIVDKLLPKDGKTLLGLRSKLDKLADAGYTISEKERDELLLWASLRNALSHAPPEQYRPANLYEKDIVEYKELAKNLCIKWLAEQPEIKKIL